MRACVCVRVIRGLSDPTLIRLDIISTKDKRVCMDLFSALWLCACRNTKRTSTHTLKGVWSHFTLVPNLVGLLLGLVVQRVSDPRKPGLSCDTESWEKPGKT